MKRKIPQFAEDQRFHQAKKWPAQWEQSNTPLNELQWEIEGRVNEPRLQSAISKIGSPLGDKRRSRKIFRLMEKEIWEEIKEEKEELIKNLTEKEKAKAKKILQREIGKIMENENLK